MYKSIDGKEVSSTMTFQMCTTDCIIVICYIVLNCNIHQQQAQMLKVKDPDIYIPLVIGKPEQQQFTIQSGILNSNSIRQCSAISGCPLPKQTYFQSSSLQQDVPTYAPASCTMAFSPQCSLATTRYFSTEYYQVRIASHLFTPDGWKAELA